MTDARGNRRQFLAGLAAAGTASVAGCTDDLWGADSGPSFTAADAGTVITDSLPPVDWPVPVVPTSSAVDEGLERVDALLAAVPDPVDAETVPNGVVRKAIVDNRVEAREHRDDAAEAIGDDLYHALQSTRDARAAARTATATFDSVEDEGLVDELLEERRAVESRVRDGLETIEYRGDDTDAERLRAALLYARLESDLRGAATRLDDRSWDVSRSSDVVEIGSGAAAVESGASATAVWDHLGERHDDRLEDPTDLTPIFDAALEASIDRVDATDLPGRIDGDWLERAVDVDLDDQHLQYVLSRAVQPVSRARDGLTEASADGRYGTGLHEALRFEQRYRAFERVRDRIEDGTLSRPDTVEGIRTERTAAIDAAASVRESLTAPSLGTYVLAETLRSLEWADDGVRRAADNDPEVGVSLTTEFGDYARLRAQLEVLPDAVAAFRERLLGA